MILLTGGTGFVGRHLISELKNKYKVRCLVRDLNLLRGFELAKGDLGDIASLEKALEGIDKIIHLAAAVKGDFKKVNWEGTANLVRAAASLGAKKIVHMSTLGAMPNPKYPYAFSEWMAEVEVMGSGLDYVILRPSIIFGRGDPFIGGLIKIIKKSPLVPITSPARFQPIWVEDVVRCIIISLEEINGQIIPLGGPEILSFEEIVDIIMNSLHLRKPKIRLSPRVTKALVNKLRAVGINTPFVPGHFLRSDNVAGLGVVEGYFGFEPKRLSDFLKVDLN
jgi:NADH dehydrogenase